MYGTYKGNEVDIKFDTKDMKNLQSCEKKADSVLGITILLSAFYAPVSETNGVFGRQGDQFRPRMVDLFRQDHFTLTQV